MGKPSNLRVSKLIDKLQEMCPAAFPKKPLPKVPLAIGTCNKLIEFKNNLGENEKTIRRAMKVWCKGYRYYTALSVIGAPRYNLFGEQEGEVTEKDVQYAIEKLKRYSIANAKIGKI